MLHVPITPAIARLQLPPLKPSAYLKLRRVAAGLSIADVARIIAPDNADRREAVALVALLEAGGSVARKPQTLRTLQRAFRFDAAVYRQLAEAPVDRHPTVCRTCGCSEWDPCQDGDGRCGWASPTACTRCAERLS
ncbi:MAG: hypothetical protein WCS75_01405 [Sphingomonas sp.]|jgi:hypothetical protein|uniref:hypothetical protein n=1 Tax=Sphingomonas sp. TaxID=28214 RepID=UPI003562C0D9